MTDITQKEIGYAYPTSTRAEEFGCSKTGCYFVQFDNGGGSGPFDTLTEAEEWADERFPNVPYGRYSMNVFQARGKQ